MQITIQKTVLVLEAITAPDKFKNDEPLTKIYFEESSIHHITKTKQTVVESLKVSDECKTIFVKGKTYLLELAQSQFKEDLFYKVVKATEVK